ncbi:MAG: DUF3078 domain-containing protein [Rikenellaceae bacterium]|nr:DUF3078 domain-containing protein [Rikenellaceae bacterium]
MRKFLGLFLVAMTLSIYDACAQFTVESENKEAKQKVEFKPIQIKNNMNVETDYYSEAREKAERKRIRQERNAFSLSMSLQGTMASYNDAWGGDNSTAVQATIGFNHTYAKDKFNINTQGEARMGYNRVRVDVKDEESGEVTRKGIWFKNVDKFWLQTRPGRKINDHWSYTATGRIESQLAKVYKSRTAQEDTDVTKAFLAPADVSLSLGFTYKSNSKKWPITLSLNALSTNGTLVYNDDLKKIYEDKNATSYFGVDIDKHATFSGGSQIQFDLNSRKWGKKGWLSYRTQVIAYYGWITNVMNNSKINDYERYLDELEAWEAAGSNKDTKPASVPRHVRLHPTVGWKNWINLKLSNYISTSFYHELQYNKAQNTAVRMYSTLTIGLSYTFNSK